ncbi:monovalent cation/H+ antiporter subunit D, partial [Pseudomonas aeruginosa]
LHSTWIAVGLFLLADLLASQRDGKAENLVPGPALQNLPFIGEAFIIGAIPVSCIAPSTRFFGTVLLLQSVAAGRQGPALRNV